MSNWYVYVLRCADGSLYTGITTDPGRRLREHNEDSKLAARYTRARRPVRLVYQECVSSRAQAARRERHIKGLQKRAKESLVAQCGGDLAVPLS